MGANMDYANTEAIKQIGVLGTHDGTIGKPAGWTDSLIDKIHQDISHWNATHTGRYQPPFDWNGYNQEQKDTYQWYKDNVLETSHWKELVKTYQGTTQPATVKPDAFDPHHTYIPTKDSGFVRPNIPAYDVQNNPDGNLVVSHQAIQHFIDALKAVADPAGTGILIDAHNQLKDVHMKPGGFAKAEVMRQKIEGTGSTSSGLKGEAMDLMLTLQTALVDLQVDLKQMMDEYETAEEFNTVTTTQLDGVMDDAWAQITSVGNHGSSSA
ncbi:hypothetical protein [Actinoplanes palleronii]|uniref:Secretion protein EspA n=1 Tax=Actinoplanes palleronii TaxID=113570 RepID=A0ABQ4BFX9_9ACTN|nr:hypothetical protein [Actinoplanes palleronii]GIE69593.1 hypothetical protein Apa02nite_057010 [Actinoplanes palleronii]